MLHPIRVLIATLAALLIAGGAFVVPAQADSEPAPLAKFSKVKQKKNKTEQVKKVKVNWKGNWKRPKYQKSIGIPGIGRLDLTCKPWHTRIRLFTSNRQHETQMWMQKYEIKNGRRVVAVKNARIYKYAHADDNGKGGTGFYAHEGLNQTSPIENRSSGGYMYGIISQRPGRDKNGTNYGSFPKPVTTFELTWFWNGFHHPQKYKSCKMKGVFTTKFKERSNITWRGSESSGPMQEQTYLTGIGWLHMRCPRDEGDLPIIWFDPIGAPTPEKSYMYLEEVQGEGQVDFQVEKYNVEYDPETDIIGEFPLPRNGSLRIKVTNGNASRWVLVSSYYVTNDTRPHRNLCETAAGSYKR